MVDRSINMLTYLKNIYAVLVIKKSEFFNKSWYIRTYQDLTLMQKLFPAIHYTLYGWKEGKNPGPEFNSKYYMTIYDDVAKDNINPLFHYEKYGKAEKRSKAPINPLVAVVQKSPYFDNEWYSRYYLQQRLNITPLSDFFTNKVYDKNPGPIFYSQEYLYLNPDVKMHSINPFLHYVRFGKYEGRSIALTELKSYQPPKNTITIEQSFAKRNSYDKNVITVFALFSNTGIIETHVIYLLRALHQISDYIIVIMDSFIHETELNKVQDLCNIFIAKRHEEYDFGSYKMGYMYLISNNILLDNDNLLFINDSNYGPIYPLTNVIEHYKKQHCDFYGLSVGRAPDNNFIQSFFYIFKSQVFKSDIFKHFMRNIKKEITPAWVINNYEYKLTKILTNAGYSYSTYVCNSNFMIDKNHIIPTKYAVTLLEDYKYPFVKRKVLRGSTEDKVDDILKHIESCNKELYQIIIQYENTLNNVDDEYINIPSKYSLFKNYDSEVNRIKNKVTQGIPIKVIFFIYSVESFAGYKVMELMQQDSIFDVELYFIPRISIDNKDIIAINRKNLEKIQQKYLFVKTAAEIKETKNGLDITKWNNIIEYADIICYPSIRDISLSLYNPYYAVRKNKLSFFISNELSCYLYDRNLYASDNINNFWKIFLATNSAAKEYKQFGQCNGVNAYTTGYAKMDSFKLVYKNNNRKQIILAPYFDIDNSHTMLSLFAFKKYNNLLFKLPHIFPDIDFIYLFSNSLIDKLNTTTDIELKSIDAYIKIISQYQNAQYKTEDNYLNIIAESDAIIMDNGRLLLEYGYTHKPSCFIARNSDMFSVWFNSLGKKYMQFIYKAYNDNDIINFIEDTVIRGNDYLYEDRKSFFNTEINNNADVNYNIFNIIKKEFV